MMSSTSAHSGQAGLSYAGNRMTDSSYSITDITLEQAIVRIKEIEEENKAHRDNLREHNAVMREHHEKLCLWRQKEHEKFEQAKALITALKEENQDMQVQMMTLKDKDKEMSTELSKLTEVRSHLQRQKAMTEQRMLNIVKQAEEQGVKDLARHLIADCQSGNDSPALDSIVYVSTSEKEGEIEKLEASLANKDDIIGQLRTEKFKRDAEVDSLRETTKQLLQDMESQQKLKEGIQNENHNLTKQLFDLQKQNQQKMQLIMAKTKREMQAPLSAGYVDQNQLPTLVCEMNNSTTLSERTSGICPNPEEIMGIIQSLDTEKHLEESRKELETKLEKEIQVKKALQKEVDRLKTELECIGDEKKKLQAGAQKDLETLRQQYEQKLLEVAQRGTQNEQCTQPYATEDISILRSQVITLIRDVDEAYSKNSALTETLHLKDKKISDLENSVRSLQSENAMVWQGKKKLSDNLNAQYCHQQRADQEREQLRHQNEELQTQFSKLVNDFTDLEETFAKYRVDMNEKLAKKTSEETLSNRASSRRSMEEINRLTAQVMAAEEALASKEEKISQLQHIKEEEGQLLRMQAETYKSDFLAERESRAKIAQERLTLISDVNALQEQNRQLKEELYNQQQIYNMQVRHTGIQNPQLRNSNATSPSTNAHMLVSASPSGGVVSGTAGSQTLPGQCTAPPLVYPHPVQQPANNLDDDEDFRSFQQYECPSCRLQFPDADTVQLHVTECLERDTR